MPPSAQEEEYNPSHLPPEDRLRRETGKAQVGGGAHAGMARPLPQAVDTLREAGRHSRSLPPSGLLAHLPQLPLVRVLQCTLSHLNSFLSRWLNTVESPSSRPGYLGALETTGAHEVTCLPHRAPGTFKYWLST